MVVDASVWVAWFVASDVHHAASRAWVARALAAGATFEDPRLVLPEVAGAVARRTGRPADGHLAVSALLASPDLRLIDVDDAIGREAARLAADLRLRGADAVYVALARTLATPLVTWDAEIQARASSAIQALPPG